MSKPAEGISGKLLIAVVMAVALTAAGASWWFRYASTHRAAKLWGPKAAQLIRDAPQVTLLRLDPSIEEGETARVTARRDISAAHGLVHLRAALLEDHSFDWPVPESPPSIEWTCQLQFSESADPATAMAAISFSPDFRWAFAASGHDSTGIAISCRPIAAGLREFFAEQAAADTEQTGESEAPSEPRSH